MSIKSKRRWEPGRRVRVGFLELLVVEVRAHDVLLVNADGVAYSFEPHRGLRRL